MNDVRNGKKTGEEEERESESESVCVHLKEGLRKRRMKGRREG